MQDQTAGPGQLRIASVDLLRGLVMIIMALDHVRDFWSFTAFPPEDLTQSSPVLFFTRWITHFCAPVFVFLSGTSAWLYRTNRGASRAELSRFLLSRGLWLILVEVVLITFLWQFGYQFFFLQVIWAIGWSMVFLAGLIFLPTVAIVALSLGMILLHNLLDGIAPDQFGTLAWLWSVLHVQNFLPDVAGTGFNVFVAYPLIPWIGVMAAGYAFGALYQQEPARRNRLFLQIGLGATAAFLILRGVNFYGDSAVARIGGGPWSEQERGAVYTFLSFLNATKYPPSLLFLLMTLGPAIALLPSLERWRGRVADMVTVFGRVPFFYYVLHLLLIHLSAKIWLGLQFGDWDVQFYNPQSWPTGYAPNLLRAYAVWILIVAVLYFPCKWFVGVRRRNKAWWLSYL